MVYKALFISTFAYTGVVSANCIRVNQTAVIVAVARLIRTVHSVGLGDVTKVALARTGNAAGVGATVRVKEAGTTDKS